MLSFKLQKVLSLSCYRSTSHHFASALSPKTLVRIFRNCCFSFFCIHLKLIIQKRYISLIQTLSSSAFFRCLSFASSTFSWDSFSSDSCFLGFFIFAFSSSLILLSSNFLYLEESGWNLGILNFASSSSVRKWSISMVDPLLRRALLLGPGILTILDWQSWTTEPPSNHNNLWIVNKKLAHSQSCCLRK